MLATFTNRVFCEESNQKLGTLDNQSIQLNPVQKLQKKRNEMSMRVIEFNFIQASYSQTNCYRYKNVLYAVNYPAEPFVTSHPVGRPPCSRDLPIVGFTLNLENLRKLQYTCKTRDHLGILGFSIKWDTTWIKLEVWDVLLPTWRLE